jgi:ubiquinone/menaquinone biosynthesis C-methylase UbiE
MSEAASFVPGFEFDHMSRRPLYAGCVQHLIDRCDIRPHSKVVDLGCGSGAGTRLLLERFPNAADLRILGIDPSEAELSIARARIADSRVTLVHARAQDAVALASGADAAILCNVIHQIPPEERREVCAAAFQMLKPGGRLGVSTLFYAGAILPATRQFNLVWMQCAREYLRAKGADLDVSRQKSASLQFFTAEQHRELLTGCGFVHVDVEEPVVQWRVEDWQALSGYSVFIQGALGHAMDLKLGREALQASVGIAYARLGVHEVPRGWVYVTGRKPRV